MGVRLERKKPRHTLASLFYLGNRLVPLAPERKLDVMLDLAWIGHRISLENAGKLGIKSTRPNCFLLDRIGPTDHVLEIGSNSGRVLSTIKAVRRVGVDYDRDAISQGKALHPDIEFVEGDAREFLESSTAFDVLILSHVLEHLDEPEAFLASLEGKFRRIYIEVPDFDWTELNDVRQRRGRDLIFMDNDHVSEFDRDEMEAMFERLGLRVIASEFRYGLMRYWIEPAQAPARPT